MVSLDTAIHSQEQTSQGKGWIVSLLVHILVILAFLLPMIAIKNPPPEQEGLLVNLGLPDEGEGQETPKGTESKPQPAAAAETKEVKPAPPVTARTPAREVKSQKMTSTVDSPISSKEVSARKAAEAEAQREAAEQARQQEAYNKTKKSYGDLLGTGGKGNTGKPGSQGDPNGDPNASNLTGISTGSGRVGGGLGNRGVLHEPQINDHSQKTGRVVISVCVDKNGKVQKAEYTQKGSTTTDSELKEIARKAAFQFKFTQSDIEEQCGTITVDFKIKGQ